MTFSISKCYELCQDSCGCIGTHYGGTQLQRFQSSRIPVKYARISNSAGTLAAIISTIGTGYFVQWLGSFQAFLTVTAGLYFVTAIFWNVYATGERVF
ncbi:hypothetical protein Tco_1492672 [Tanacetum coccineum]